LDAHVQFCGLNFERAVGSHFVDVDAVMMRGGTIIVNEMEF
jgi:hypothetical protein